MKFKLFLAAIMTFIVVSVSLFASSSSFQRAGNYINTKEYPGYSTNLSSYTIFCSSAVPYGVERIFKINGTPTGNIYFQRGSSSTIVSNGMSLDANTYYVEDLYFGDIYFLTNSGNADLRISTLRKE